MLYTTLAVSGWGAAVALTGYTACLRGRLQKARVDPVTGLQTRHSFELKAPRLMNVEPETTCLIMDLDKLKTANDAHGHSAGDQLIRNAANALSTCCPEGAQVARIGGDEFVAVWPGPPSRAHLDELIGQVACSVGVVSYSGSRIKLSDIMTSADQVMYMVKKAGGCNYSVERNIPCLSPDRPNRWRRSGQEFHPNSDQ